ncbi:hypothetical protein LZ30DRAFT_793302, partial [Colletotrichum cereale]
LQNRLRTWTRELPDITTNPSVIIPSFYHRFRSVFELLQRGLTFFMEDDLEEELRRYGGSRHDITEHSQSSHPYRIQIEAITQETYSWGSIAAVYRTSDSLKQQKQREGRFGDVSVVLRHIKPHSNDDDVRPVSQLEIQSDTLKAEFKEIAKGIASINLD